MTEIIGVGEKSALTILTLLFPHGEFETQKPLTKLLSSEQVEHLGEHQQKQTIDIMMKLDKDLFAVRIQDKSHKGIIRARWDMLQRNLLNQRNIFVIDVMWYEAIELFKERVNFKSVQEIISAIKTAGLEMILPSSCEVVTLG